VSILICTDVYTTILYLQFGLFQPAFCKYRLFSLIRGEVKDYVDLVIFNFDSKEEIVKVLLSYWHLFMSILCANKNSNEISQYENHPFPSKLAPK
jgi:hypothetical protein